MFKVLHLNSNIHEFLPSACARTCVKVCSVEISRMSLEVIIRDKKSD